MLDDTDKVIDILTDLNNTFKQAEQKKLNFDDIWNALKDFYNDISGVMMWNVDIIDAGALENLVFNAVGSQICADTIMEKPVMTTNWFAKTWIKDRLEQNINNKLYKNLLQKVEKNNYPWFKFPDSFNNANKAVDKDDIADIAHDIIVKVIQPIMGQTGFKPKNKKQVLQAYYKHHDINETNYGVSDGISISDQLDNNQDRLGLMSKVRDDMIMDKFCLNMIKKGKYNYVISPKNLTPSYI